MNAPAQNYRKYEVIGIEQMPWRKGVAFTCADAEAATHGDYSIGAIVYISDVQLAQARFKMPYTNLESLRHKAAWYDRHIKPIKEFGNGIFELIEQYLGRYVELIKQCPSVPSVDKNSSHSS